MCKSMLAVAVIATSAIIASAAPAQPTADPNDLQSRISDGGK
jgi:hypothetical protein